MRGKRNGNLATAKICSCFSENQKVIPAGSGASKTVGDGVPTDSKEEQKVPHDTTEPLEDRNKKQDKGSDPKAPQEKVETGTCSAETCDKDTKKSAEAETCGAETCQKDAGKTADSGTCASGMCDNDAGKTVETGSCSAETCSKDGGQTVDTGTCNTAETCGKDARKTTVESDQTEDSSEDSSTQGTVLPLWSLTSSLKE